MNEVILKELKLVIERAVRPVPASMTRKRRMREELLAHLTAIFEEEAKLVGDDLAALNQAKRRFGDLRELTGQIQETVPWWDRLARMGEALQCWPGESLLRFTARITVVTLMLLPIVMAAAVTPLLLSQGRQNDFAAAARSLFIIGVLNVPIIVGMTVLVDGMYLSLYRQPLRRWRRAMVYGIASLAFFPLLALVWCWSLTGDLAMGWTQLRLACCVAPLGPLLFAGLAKQTAERLRYYEEWASLEIDE